MFIWYVDSCLLADLRNIPVTKNRQDFLETSFNSRSYTIPCHLLFIVTNYKLSNGDIKDVQFVVETDKDEIIFDKKNASLGLLRTLEKQVNHH